MKNERGKRKSNPQTGEELLIKAFNPMRLTGKKRDIDPEPSSPNPEVKNPESNILKRPRSNAISE